MKKNKKIYKIITALLVFGLVTFLFAGCQSNNASAKTQGTGRGFNQAQMKQRYSDKLKELVTNGTINQTQSDKILTALTTQMQSGFRRSQNNGQGNSQSGSQSNNQNNNQSNGQGSQQNRQSFNPLIKLVQDGTITQQQADTVWQSLRGNRNGNNNGNTNNSTNSKSSNVSQQ